MKYNVAILIGRSITVEIEPDENKYIEEQIEEYVDSEYGADDSVEIVYFEQVEQ